MDPIRKIPNKVTKKFANKVINRQYFHRKTRLKDPEVRLNFLTCNREFNYFFLCLFCPNFQKIQLLRYYLNVLRLITYFYGFYRHCIVLTAYAWPDDRSDQTRPQWDEIISDFFCNRHYSLLSFGRTHSVCC